MTREDRIKNIFIKSGLSQGDFAKKIGVSQQIISDVFRGKKKAGEKILLGMLDNIDGIDPLWLFTGKGNSATEMQMLKKHESTMEEKIANKVCDKLSTKLEFLSVQLEKLNSHILEK